MRTSLSLILLSLSLGGCCGGVEVGNPGCTQFGSPTSSNGESSINYAQAVQNRICFKLEDCNVDGTSTRCFENLPSVTNIDVELGLTDGFGTYQDIIDADAEGRISANSANGNQCLSDITDLSCGQITSAYDPSDPDNFANVYLMIPSRTESCGGLYQSISIDNASRLKVNGSFK